MIEILQKCEEVELYIARAEANKEIAELLKLMVSCRLLSCRVTK